MKFDSRIRTDSASFAFQARSEKNVVLAEVSSCAFSDAAAASVTAWCDEWTGIAWIGALSIAVHNFGLAVAGDFIGSEPSCRKVFHIGSEIAQ